MKGVKSSWALSSTQLVSLGYLVSWDRMVEPGKCNVGRFFFIQKCHNLHWEPCKFWEECEQLCGGGFFFSGVNLIRWSTSTAWTPQWCPACRVTWRPAETGQPFQRRLTHPSFPNGRLWCKTWRSGEQIVPASLHKYSDQIYVKQQKQTCEAKT